MAFISLILTEPVDAISTWISSQLRVSVNLFV